MAQAAPRPPGSVETTHVRQQGAKRGLAWAALVAFVGASVLLIVLTWRDNLSTQDTNAPAYYRDTFVVDESVYATVTAEAAQNPVAPAATPQPERP